MKLTQVRRHAMSLADVTEEPHHALSSFRVRGRIFVTFPPEGDHVRVFVDEFERERALAMHPAFVSKLLWGGKVAGLRIDLASAQPAVVKALVSAAWEHRARSAGARPAAR
ncbi:MAG: MmcQ/YjbR family DNA-binding protein [Burkholderiales bacterium]|nr:MmcQ/YjbR family DNA-binding protein [Burkholderiales bacterium]MDE1928644.1 MmcQ/YjbR family DNA-binding protein [Burkholderiales bacterium]MDE2161216.1 MmcQ/YjbR family DNA-binding protein [Burkholderiales bacterium]MDE2502915.1 MmcQ/YjbR family DNA-binding protein [Burkholderiales bacterium]